MVRGPGWMLPLVLLGACAGDTKTDGDPASETARVVAEAELGPVSAIVRMSPAAPRFGDRVRFQFEATASAGAKLEAPEFGARLGHFRIRDRRDDSRIEQGRLQMEIVAEPERTGVNIGRLPVIRFSVTEGEGAGSERELVLPPFEVDVAGLTPDQQPELADLGTPLPPVALPVERGVGLGVWVAGFGAVAAAAAFWWLRRRGRADAGLAAAEIDPETEAARAFDALRESKLTEQGRFAEYYVRLTGIVRRYIERTTGVHAPEQTTEEFLREMEAHPAFDGSRRRELTDFLAAADLVKYAAQVPTGEETEGSFVAARAFCGLTARSPEVAA